MRWTNILSQSLFRLTLTFQILALQDLRPTIRKNAIEEDFWRGCIYSVSAVALCLEVASLHLNKGEEPCWKRHPVESCSLDHSCRIHYIIILPCKVFFHRYSYINT